MSRSYISSPPQAPSWHVLGQLFSFCQLYAVTAIKDKQTHCVVTRLTKHHLYASPHAV
jgi:hypothetical protein